MAHFTEEGTSLGSTKTQHEMQAFLDAEQYADRNILKYECCFGTGYMSCGGADTTREYCAKLGKLPTGAKVLDIGCGVGGSAFYFAAYYGADVLGIDLSSNSVRAFLLFGADLCAQK
jgi:phosphoethanolamine N-methyltransferase